MNFQIAKRINHAFGRFAVPLQHFRPVLRNNMNFPISAGFNGDWSKTERGSTLSFVRSPIIRKTDKVFTMGSCFAREISYALSDAGFNVYPRYNQIQIDNQTQKPFKLHTRNHMNHYNTFTIRYEFEHAFGQTHYQPEDFVHLNSDLRPSDNRAWQDPYRRQIYAANEEAIIDLSHKIDDCIRDGILAADVYVITLGLTEVWRNDKNGLYLNQAPHGAERGSEVDGYTFVQSTYEQNYENMERVCSQIAQYFPGRKIVLTVSPVALKRTFSSGDIIVANMESKSILRAVAGAINRKFDNVVYWPSYEIATTHDVYEADGRHVTAEAVRGIIDQFIAVHLDG